MATQRKISAAFEDRLDRMDPAAPVQVVLLVTLPTPPKRSGSMSHEQRLAVLRDNELAGDRAVREIDRLLAEFGGKRLSPVDGLGSTVVVCRAGSIHELSKLEQVEAIMENQSMNRLQRAAS